MPNFGGGKPPKLGEDQRQRLLDLLRDGQPWKKQEIQHLTTEQQVDFPMYSSISSMISSSSIFRTKVHHVRKMPKRFSTNASATRSTMSLTTFPTTKRGR